MMNAVPVVSASPSVIALRDPLARDPARAGVKASRLAALLAAGHPVPDGVVVTVEVSRRALDALGPDADPGAVAAWPLPPEVVGALGRAVGPGGPLAGAVAVRSSGVAEDLAGASFAGQYETVLDVRGEAAVVAAVQRCLASAFAARVRAYRASLGDPLPAGMAVLVQRMVPAEAAGVAFTAHPVTGARDVVVVSAVRGLGEALVSGAESAEEWELRGDEAVRRRSTEPCLDAGAARAVAALARLVEAGAGCPQDIEWAAVGSEVALLQARPMTALPDPVAWAAPGAGAWVRNFRLGEWLGDPVTPLFASWAIPRMEERFRDTVERRFGLRVPTPAHAVVHGWYFFGLDVMPSTAEVLRRLPVMLWRFARNFRAAAAMTPPLAHLGFDHAHAEWRDALLPAYEAAVAEGAAAVEGLDGPGLVALVDRLLDAAGDQFTSIVSVAGYGAKAELPLVMFWKEHLAAVDGSPLHLVRGDDDGASADHHVQGLDWVHPTFGETGQRPAAPSDEVKARVRAERDAVEAAAREVLAARPRLRRRFDALLAEARRAYVARQQQTGRLTLAWPLLRRALARLGALAGLARPDDVFFVTRDELCARLDAGASLPLDLAARRALWNRQRRLSPPLLLGELTGVWKKTFAQIDALLHDGRPAGADELRGMPGSPGRARGPVRVLRSLDELPRLRPGEVLVVPVTTPAWTPAFSVAAAVVTDTGSIASHASIVAREYGIPAAVAVEGATARLCDGQWVTVDGSRGVVTLDPR